MVINRIKKVIKFSLGILLPLLLISCGSASGPSASAGSTTDGGKGGSDGQKENTGGVNVTNVFSSPKELGVGDILYVDFSAADSLDFEGVDSDASFTFVVANAASASGNFTVKISGDLTEAGLDLAKSVAFSDEVASDFEDAIDITADFHDLLRNWEGDLEGLESPQYSYSTAKALTADPAISTGDTGSFKVLSSFNSSSSSVSVDATVECVGSNVVFYVDDRVTETMLSNADILALCSQFDQDAEKEYNLFGQASDVNGDGKLAVLFTPQVNALGALGGGIITGFFNASDLYPNTKSNPSGNYTEILYIMVPDPNGTYGVPVSRSFAMSNLLPTVLVHELQHAISYNQHVFINGSSAEESWLNEGLSHLTEDLLGHGQENPSRYAIFLKNPHAYSLVTSSPGLGARGGAYLFLRFLYEQSLDGGLFVRNLLQTAKRGVTNIETAFGSKGEDFDQFGEYFLRWTIALAMTDRGLSADRRYTYQPRVKNSSTGNYQGVCLICGAEDGRKTVLNGVSSKTLTSFQSATTAPNASRYYEVDGIKEELNFTGTSSLGEGFGVLIRVK